MIATGLGAGILLDATIVRALLLPAVMSLLGRINWWLPPGLARVLHPPAPVGESPAERRALAEPEGA
jgi:RND superfamily putative drug exporter